MRAYHFSELPMVMGTHEIERGPSTDFQRQLSGIMQDMWLDFARDPEKGLSERWGWEPASSRDSEAMVLGREGVLFRQGNKSKTSGNIAVVGGKREE
jgi:carboxylesterase type B